MLLHDVKTALSDTLKEGAIMELGRKVALGISPGIQTDDS